jgi:hypothetical protein
MTLGRTSSGAIKIKTDDGLRAVSCGCCGNCGIAVFTEGQVAPTNPPKFKYITVEIDMPLYNIGSFNSSLPANEWVCEGDGDFITCMPFPQNQGIASERKSYKITSRLKIVPNVFNQDGTPFCGCEVVKASGIHESFREGWSGKEHCEGPNCWFRSSYEEFISSIEDASWTTWADENGKLYLKEKTTAAKWGHSVCIGQYADQWDNKWEGTEHCPSSIRCGPGIYFTDFPSHMGPNSGWVYSEPASEMGFLKRQFNRVYQTNLGDVYETESHTLHNTLAEIWGQNQLEMRP